MPTLRLFASAREAAGIARVDFEGSTVADVLEAARGRYGERFTAVLETSRVWVNGQPADDATPVSGFDVIAVLPPVSGGASAAVRTLHLVREPLAAGPAAPPPLPDWWDAVEATAHQRLEDAPLLRLVPPPPPPPLPAPAPVPVSPVAPAAGGGPALARALPEPAPEPDEPPAASATTKVGPALAVVPKSSRPHGRLGLAWAVVVTVVTVLGPGWLAAWMAVAAMVAASQTALVWRARNERPLPGFAAATAAALPLAATAGVTAMNTVVVVAVVVMLVARLGAPTKAPFRDVALTLVVGVAVGLAAAAPVMLREIGVHAPLFLLAIAAAYDAGAYVVGTGASSPWEGPAAGVAATIPLTMFAAILLVPPFGGAVPILLGALGALLAPLGPLAGSALLGDANANAPALRRLDSLLVLGPIWAWCAAAFLL